jgi:hypothetical protein
VAPVQPKDRVAFSACLIVLVVVARVGLLMHLPTGMNWRTR